MTELEQRLMNELTNFAEQYAKDQRQLTEQVERLAAQYTQDQNRLDWKVERFETEVRRFVEQLKLGEKQSNERAPTPRSDADAGDTAPTHGTGLRRAPSR